MTSSVPIRVLIVDDSAVMRELLQRVFKDQSDIEIVGTASNGKLALERVQKNPVDIITLDIEMPQMDGLTALPELLKIAPHTRIIMVSTLTERNASISIKALGMGASDYITKPTTKDEQTIQQFHRELLDKVRALAPRQRVAAAHIDTPAPHVAKLPPALPKAKSTTPEIKVPTGYPKSPVRAIAIGSSTGGPQALLNVFKALAPRFPNNVPVFITQHMPPTFTTILAEQLKNICGRPCAEGKDGEAVIPGSIYLAPGNYHMQPEKLDGKIIIRLNQNPQVNFCRPAVDPMLQSLCQIYGTGLLTVILTGMGSDGLGGAKEVVAHGGTVVAQNEETCVVWGMPRAVTEANICSAVLPLDEVAPYLIKACA